MLQEAHSLGGAPQRSFVIHVLMLPEAGGQTSADIAGRELHFILWLAGQYGRDCTWLAEE